MFLFVFVLICSSVSGQCVFLFSLFLFIRPLLRFSFVFFAPHSPSSSLICLLRLSFVFVFHSFSSFLICLLHLSFLCFVFRSSSASLILLRLSFFLFAFHSSSSAHTLHLRLSFYFFISKSHCHLIYNITQHSEGQFYLFKIKKEIRSKTSTWRHFKQ